MFYRRKSEIFAFEISNRSMRIIQDKKNLFTCPCCGYKTLPEESPGSFYICAICWWEDCNLQFDDPDFVDGTPNDISMRQAQRQFYKVADNKDLTFENLFRPNEKCYDFDETWKPLDE